MRKIFGLFAALCLATLTACFSPWSGDGEGTITIAFGAAGPAGRVAVQPEEIAGLSHYITLTGPGGTTITYYVTGAGSVSFAVIPGTWTVRVRAIGDRPDGYNEDFFTADRMLRAIGFAEVEVVAGRDAAANISMVSAVEVSCEDQFFNAFEYENAGRPDGSEKIIFITGDIEISNTVFIEGGTVNITLASDSDITIVRGSGGYMFNVAGEYNTLRLGWPGMAGSITIDGNSVNNAWSIIGVSAYATLEMNDGVTLTGNITDGSGGAVHVSNGGTFIMHGGVISYNHAAAQGGGVYVANDGRFEKTGGDISSTNTAYSYRDGNAVFLSGVDFDRYYNGPVRGTPENPFIWPRDEYTPPRNVLLLRPDGEQVWFGCLGEALDEITASGNYAIYVYQSPPLAPRTLEAGANIVLRGRIPECMIMLSGPGSLFTVDSGTLTLVEITLQGMGQDPGAENTAPLVVVGPGGTLVMSDGSVITGNHNASRGGNLLGGGVRVEGIFRMYAGEISGNRGGLNEASGGGVFVAGGGIFIMGCGDDLPTDPPRIRNNNAGNWGGGGVFIDHNGDRLMTYPNFTMHRGVIEGNTAQGGGGGVHIGAWDNHNDATFTMHGGIIRGNRAYGSGGGVFVNAAPVSGEGSGSSTGRFSMYGGEISGNFALGAGSNGAGVFVVGNFDMTGGTIKGNEAGGGGGVYVSRGIFAMSGAAMITDNDATTSGGGVGVGVYGRFDMNGGSIYNNTATTNGGGVSVVGDTVNSGTFEMAGGRIERNDASSGGGVHVADHGIFRMSGGFVFGEDAAPPSISNTAGAGASVFVGQLATAEYAGVLEYLGTIETTDYTLPGAISGVTVSVNGGPARRYNNLGAVLTSIADEAGDYTITLFEPQQLVNWTLSPSQHITLQGWNDEHGVITHNGVAGTSMFNIQNASLTLGNNITLRGRPDGTAPSIVVGTSGTLTMLEGSEISGHTTVGNISPILISGGSARLDIQGGKITGNNNMDGRRFAAVDLNNGVLIMSGGSIRGNNTNASGEWADVAMSTNPAVTVTLSGTAEIGAIRLSPSGAPDPDGTTRVAIGAGWTGSVGRLDLAHSAATPALVAEHWDGRIVLSGSGGHTLTADDVAQVALGYFVTTAALATDTHQPITGFVIGTSGAELGRLVPPPAVTVMRDGGEAVRAGTLAAALSLVTGDNVPHTITLYEDQELMTWPLPGNRHIILRGSGGERIVSLDGGGSLFTVGPSDTLVLDENITLQGHCDNDASLVTVGEDGTLVMRL